MLLLFSYYTTTVCMFVIIIHYLLLYSSSNFEYVVNKEFLYIKYLAPCLAQRCHFTPFIVSADGLLGREADAMVCKLAFTYAEKTDKPYSVVCGFMRNRISIAILRATHRCLRGSRIPSGCMSSPHPQWLDGAGLSLYPQ